MSISKTHGSAVRDEPTRISILREGIDLTGGDRNAAYGEPVINLTAAGRLKQAAKEMATRDIGPAEWEALDMVLTKLSRILTGPQIKRDNYVDLATYSAMAGEVAAIEAEHR